MCPSCRLSVCHPRAAPPRLLVSPALQAAVLGEDHWDFYACTLSNRTIVYKGMLNSAAGGWAHGRDGSAVPTGCCRLACSACSCRTVPEAMRFLA